MTVVGPEYVQYISAAGAVLADTSTSGSATFVVSEPDLALPGGSTTAGVLVYNVTSPSQVWGVLHTLGCFLGRSKHAAPLLSILSSFVALWSFLLLNACLVPGYAAAHAAQS